MYYQISTEEIKRLILPLLEQESIELVEMNLIRAQGGPILKILVDRKEGGITIGECARLNDKISDLLDSQDTIKDRHILEISSPGLDRPLRTKSDFLRCLNRKVGFFLNESINGKIELDGVINKVENESVYLETEAGVIEIPLPKINRAKQLIDNRE